MRLPSVPRGEVINRLTKVFRNVGFERASLSHLAQEAGLQRSSLYHLFPGGKEQMAEEVLAHANEIFESQVLGTLSGKESPQERFARMTSSISHYYRNGDDACLLGLFAVEQLVGRRKQLIQSGFRRWRAQLTALFEDEGFGKVEAVERANEVIALIQGALVTSRGLGDARIFRSVIKRLPKHAFAITN